MTNGRTEPLFFCQLDKKKKKILVRTSGGISLGKPPRLCDKLHAERCWRFRRCCSEHRWTFPHLFPVQVGTPLIHRA